MDQKDKKEFIDIIGQALDLMRLKLISEML